MEILIATNNVGKFKEFKELLCDLPINLKYLRDFPEIQEISETGSTYFENALIKAKAASLATGLCSLADDSGLEVESLDNRPGVYSARYGGNALDNVGKINKLLAEIENNPNKGRKAKFICELVLTNANGEVLASTEGRCEGSISDKPYGINGFGYDSIFIPDGYSNTFGEISNEIKQKISHRSKAIEKIYDFLSSST
jgi:XTP/dITP diphosphohydrolase